ncbi:hypothetical protein HELRODRAFT_181765 [Helobdella robusta]|uniref:Uncharacterized protein n=1 Tax=Helobdella robusta TaxID=6412 RepID=T1FHA9_HELRO|nr:hypothetical protein HELRODRAFT_181765 [Helobdella robusta]ESN92144.1 hypothetical protein HELRODRAFT_181765 [Helobdella robusta]
MYIRSSGDVRVLYDGVKVDTTKVHSRVSAARFDNEADVVEIEVRNSIPEDFGILASTTDGLIITDDRWQCLSKSPKGEKGDVASPNYKPAECLAASHDPKLISENLNISMDAKVIRPVTDAVDGKSRKRKKRSNNKELPTDFNCKLVIKNYPDLKRALFDPMKYRVSRGKTKLRIVARGSIKAFQDGAWLGRTPDHTNTLMLPIKTSHSNDQITAEMKQFDNNNNKNNLNTNNNNNNNNVKNEEELKISENLLKSQLSPLSLAASISTATAAGRIKRSVAKQLAEAVNLRHQFRRHGAARCDYHCRETIKKRILQSLFNINVLEVEIDNEADVLAIHVDRSLMSDREPLSNPLERSSLWNTFFGLYVESEDGSISTLPSSVPHKPAAFFENVSQLNPSDGMESGGSKDVDRIKENEYAVSKVKEGLVSDWKCADVVGSTRGGASEPWQTIHFNDKMWKEATLYKMERINRARPDNDGNHHSVDNDDGVPNSFIWSGEHPWSKQMYCRYLIPRKLLGKKKKVTHTHKRKKVVVENDEPARKLVKRSPATENTGTNGNSLKRRVRNFGEKSSIEDLKRKNEQLKASLRKVSNSERVLTEETEEMFKLLGEVNGALTEIDNKNEYGGGFMYGYDYGGKDDDDEDLVKKLGDEKKEEKKGGGGGGPKTWNEEFMEELTEV